jgi:hypothetical protein
MWGKNERTDGSKLALEELASQKVSHETSLSLSRFSHPRTVSNGFKKDIHTLPLHYSLELLAIQSMFMCEENEKKIDLRSETAEEKIAHTHIPT